MDNENETQSQSALPVVTDTAMSAERIGERASMNQGQIGHMMTKEAMSDVEVKGLSPLWRRCLP